MRFSPWLLIPCLLWMSLGCGGNNTNNGKAKPQCSDGIDNDADGLIDFPNDPGCTNADDDSEDSSPQPQCNDGRDNDMDGKVDYPADPGCSAAQQDDETDDCPDGPGCPQCGDGKDNDGNGLMDYPNDPGCIAAADPYEFTENPAVCGATMMVKQLPPSGSDTGTLATSSTYANGSPCMSTATSIVAVAYELHLTKPRVVTVVTEGSPIDTVVDIRSASCAAATSEVACNDNVSMTDTSSSLTTSLDMGTYFILVESRNGSGGAYSVYVQQFAGEGTACADTAECGPGLVCRIPTGQTAMICTQPMCNDGVDNDADNKIDFPHDPGCASPQDNDEMDDCPNGPMCPQCGNGRDDDNDGKIDYPIDPSCKSASGTSEACNTSEAVMPLTMPMTMGNTTSATDDYLASCAFGTGGKDLTYQLALPSLTSLTIDVSDPTFNFFPDAALLAASCGAPELACSSSTITQGALAAGNYYLMVDGDDAGSFGSFTIAVSGQIAGGQSCESPLAQSGALTCSSGFVCKGTAGSRICAPTECNDGSDNNMDGKIDYPNDPGCSSVADDTETTVCPGATCPVCSNGLDDDLDMKVDYPLDFGCSSAGGANEVFCSLEVDPVVAITTPAVTGTLAGLHANLTTSCSTFAAGNDKTYVLQLPVAVQTLTIDTLGTVAPVTDTVLELWDTQCTAPGVACNDDITPGSNDLSSISVTQVPAGNYAVTVKAYSTASNGAFKLNTHGIVAAGTSCTSPLFAAGVLACPPGKTCTGTPKKCQ
ncbi:MAG: cell surface receptor domain protein [Myxococcales bacterium]|nr:cell surface receptor domain protein [Myxococcales bacterium]